MSPKQVRMNRAGQLVLRMNRWGGARPGAGRKRSARPPVPHRSRAPHKSRFPVHATWRLVEGLPNLRSPRAIARVVRAISLAPKAVRVVHFSVQRDHIHLVCEARHRTALGEGLRALGIRIAKSANGLWRRRGKVFRERYHLETLTTPKQVRNTIAYVLCNFHKHRVNVGDVPRDLVDECSSGLWFDGWKPPFRGPLARSDDAPVSRPSIWLLSVGWRRWGLIAPFEVPGPRRTRVTKSRTLRARR
jgi:REP element-mobilizing transposase RayT